MRPGEVIATSDQADVILAVAQEIDPAFGFTTDPLPIDPSGALGLSLYTFDPNVEVSPLALAASADELDLPDGTTLEVAPNYVNAFAPGWKYAPYDEATFQSSTPPSGLLTTAQTEAFDGAVAVLDTGFFDPGLSGLDVSDVRYVGPVPNGTTSVSAATAEDSLDGLAAGHGTFNVGILARLLPESTIYATRVSPRFSQDDFYPRPDDDLLVSIRDEYSVTWSLGATLAAAVEQEEPVEYVNMSFGTYGCAVPVELDSVDGSYLQPLGLRRAIEQLETAEVVAFAASGNDSHGVDDAVFYPAGWAGDFDWLYSVASDLHPRSTPNDPLDDFDYANRGPYVELQAKGSLAVSALPLTSWGDAGWYSWSGTSFATPCALVWYVIDGPNIQTVSDPTAPAPPEEELDCGVNL
jgi:hypothetical protein